MTCFPSDCLFRFLGVVDTGLLTRSCTASLHFLSLAVVVFVLPSSSPPCPSNQEVVDIDPGSKAECYVGLVISVEIALRLRSFVGVAIVLEFVFVILFWRAQ